MNEAALLLLMLTHQGHWLSGADVEVSVRPVVAMAEQEAGGSGGSGGSGGVVQWQLALGRVELMKGSVQSPWTVRLKVPSVRVESTMRWRCRVYDQPGGELLGDAEAQVRVYPNNLLSGLGKRLTKVDVAVFGPRGEVGEGEGVGGGGEVGGGGGVGALLLSRSIEYQQVHNLSSLVFKKPRLLIVEEDRLTDDLLTDGRWLAMIRSGMRVLVLRQTKISSILGCDVVRRLAPREPAWRAAHPLTQALMRRAWGREAQSGPEAWAIRWKGADSGEVVMGWPVKDDQTRFKERDALVLSREVERGRIVHCQLPLSDWQHDPIAQLFLVEVVDYLLTPVAESEPDDSPPAPWKEIRAGHSEGVVKIGGSL